MNRIKKCENEERHFITYKEYNDKYAYALNIHVVDRDDGYFLVAPDLLQIWEEKRINYEKGKILI